MFNELYFNNFSINIHDHATIASHALRLFRTHFIPDECVPDNKKDGYDKEIGVYTYKYFPPKDLIIPVLSESIYINIRKSYTGGSTDMFIPSNLNNELIYGYDVNSLYPSIMKDKYIPIGIPTYFEGDIRKIETNSFGFFEVDVNCPRELQHPIIQLHIKRNGVFRTISPTGSFRMWIFSEEMYNAEKFGYTFNILRGYTFSKKILFKSYVENLYALRLQYDKSNPMNYIAKLLLNSLYGKFGMNLVFEYIQVLSQKTTETLLSSPLHNIWDITKLNEDNNLVHYNNIDNGENIKNLKINVGISSAITAYARIFMSQFKNNPLLQLYYTDTDSIYTNLNPSEMDKLYPGIVNNTELGKLKLESISRKAVFISPKCYCLELESGELIYKIKGLHKNIPFTVDEFKLLLDKDFKLIKQQEKWKKNLHEGSINLLKQTYTIQQTDNKRQLIYESNKLIGTQPIKGLHKNILLSIDEFKLLLNKDFK
jgi:hypothetical protein